MKLIRLFLKIAGMTLFLLVMGVTGLIAQNPTYLCELRNDYQVDANTFEYDMYLLRTGSTVFELTNLQAGINIDPNVLNGGTITVSLVSGTSELVPAQIPNPANLAFINSTNTIRMTPRSNPGAGNGTIISDVSPGTRVGRFRLTNTVAFGIIQPAMTWWFAIAGGYPTKVSAYVGGLAINITVQASHTTNNLVNPFLNKPVTVFNVTGTGNYCQGAPGLAVGLNGSEIGVTYTLVKNTVPTAITFAGTGAAFTFPGLQAFGTYTVTAARNATYITGTMAGDAKITEDPLLTVSVSIAANPPGAVCEGTLVTFTATPVNGGTPTYQWKVNGGNVGIGLVTYSYVPANGDQVSVVMTSSLTGCVTGSPATSNTITMTINPVPQVTNVLLNESICSGDVTNIVLTANVAGTTFSWTTTSSSPNLTGFSNGTGNVINQTIMNIGYTSETVTYHITPTANGCTGPVSDYIVTVKPVPNVSNAFLSKTICSGNGTNIVLTSNVAGTLFTWTATGSSLLVTGYSDNSIPMTTINQTLINSGFAIETVTYHITPQANNCNGPVTDYVVTVFPLADAYFVPSAQTICAGQTTNINILSHVAGSSFTWTVSASSPLVTGFSGGSGSNISQTIFSSSTLSETVTYVVTPTANGCAGINSMVVVTVNPLLPVSVSIVASENPVCPATPVTFTATPVNGGTPSYQWYAGGVLQAGQTLATFTYTPADGDQVYAIMTSSLITCVTGNPATSNTITISVAALPASVSIAASSNPVCAGSSVTFNATPVNGGTPSYEWYVGGILQAGETLPTFTYTPVNGDQVYAKMTSSLACATGSPATSNTITMTVNPIIAVSVSIVVDLNNVNSGIPVTFTATPTGGGGAPSYKWYVNTVEQPGQTASTFTYVPVNGDVVYCELYSSASCALPVPAVSGTITMNVIAVLIPSLNGATNVCFFSNEIYTTDAGMTGYVWSLPLGGGTFVPGPGANKITVTWNSAGARSVNVTYDGSIPGGTTLNVTVNPLLPVSVSISASANPVCAGTSVTFTATPVNGGLTPSYQWYNGLNPVGGNNPVYAYIPVNGDVISVVMTSSETCQSGSPATSNTVTMIVNPIPVVSTATLQYSLNPTGPWTGMGGLYPSFTMCIDPAVSFYYLDIDNMTISQPLQANTLNPFTLSQVSLPPTWLAYWAAKGVVSGATGWQGIMWQIINGNAPIFYIYYTSPGSDYQLIDGMTFQAGGGITPLRVSGDYPQWAYSYNGSVTDINGCVSLPFVVSTTFNTIPVPTITGQNPVCEGTTHIYTTEAGMTNYIWNVTGGSGSSTTNSISVTWGTGPSGSVSVNYTDANGCTANVPFIFNITINPNATIALTSAAGTNAQSLCINTAITNITYSIGGGGTGAGVTGLPTGVTGVYNAGVFTISGTPSVSGTFSYTVTTTGTCVQATATGTITVNPNATITLTSAAGTNAQSLCINTPLTNITYSIGGGGTGAGVTGLPAGVTGVYNAGVFTISGSPSVSGTFNYTVTTTGTCVQATAIGTITVNPNAAITLTSAPGTNAQSLCINTLLTNITYSIGGGGTGAGVTGLPAGVTGVYNAGIFTISGSPSVSGTFNYTITTTGTCVQATATGTITVNPNASIALTSAAGTNAQSLCINTLLTNITYAIGGSGTGAGVTGLPAGVTGVYNAGIFTISGSPSVSGTFNYTITTTGTCVQATATGTITVNPNASIALTSAAGTNAQSVCTNAAITNITYSISGGGTGAGVTGLPAGVTGVYSSGVFTISGSSSVSGTFNYTVTTTGTCVQATATGTITVNPVSVPTITGYTSMCVNIGPLDYVTESGMTGYNWTVSPGNTIYSGQGTNHVQINWLVSGVQWVAVIYTNPSGCSATAPTQLNVFVNPLPGPAGTITGTAAVCGGTNGVAYSVGTIANANSYVWSLPAGAIIATGAGTNSITVNFDPFASSGNITVYGNNTCGNGAVSPSFAVTVTPLPATAGVITGPSAVCQGVSGVIYTVPLIANATGYFWTVPTGALIVGGSNTNSITVDFSLSAISGTITVHGTNSCGNGLPGPEFQVTVNPIPPTPIVTVINDIILHSNVPTGNQWYFQGSIIPGATGQEYTADKSGEYWCVVTWNGCSSDTSNHVWIVMPGIQPDPSSAKFVIYPVPNDGRFTISINSPNLENYNIKIYNTLGVMIYEIRNVEVNGTTDRTIDLRPTPPGIYSVVIENSNNRVIRKILINR